ncbi:SRPBCC family protein [Lipingzhangella sp. LS1_29]|uniref:SRPBCC family protein n=1 Tax=Lipingzhangella rawalii TaxID=2055835 RepID=A0ABU2H168_9ACTN|nr:SRPBCC family protein [Lipingzhangella rawalii]MDS1269043.1 SRPBCC family protein [Lipingzhangella rawalii]
MVTNEHRRMYPDGIDRVGALIDTLATTEDRLWPHETWPPMRLDGPLGPGARGGHGPIRYRVVDHQPSRTVRFRFDKPRGFRGYHTFVVEAHADDPRNTVLRHTLSMRTTGLARLTWPLVYRPLHDALIEDSLDRAGRALGAAPERPARWSRYVRLLRWLLTRRRSRGS